MSYQGTIESGESSTELLKLDRYQQNNGTMSFMDLLTQRKEQRVRSKNSRTRSPEGDTQATQANQRATAKTGQTHNHAARINLASPADQINPASALGTSPKPIQIPVTTP
jgi:uncharacterized protein (DUF2252 family)